MTKFRDKEVQLNGRMNDFCAFPRYAGRKKKAIVCFARANCDCESLTVQGLTFVHNRVLCSKRHWNWQKYTKLLVANVSSSAPPSYL